MTILTKVNFQILKGLVLSNIKVTDDEIIFTTTDGQVFTQHHEQDCCEELWLEDIDGDLDDIIGDQILVAEELSSEGELRAGSKQYNATWTFYKLDTIKGGITIRWNGESNGCYSEKAELYSIR